MKYLSLIFMGNLLAGCAVLHHVQVGDIDNSRKWDLRPIDIKVSETGIDIEGAVNIGKSLTRNQKTSRQLDQINDIISMFQMGPRTGNLVFNDTYAEGLILRLYEACPSGRLTGMTSIRESMKYPVISGEIVKITGYCLVRG